MSELSIASVITRKRREKEMTQEELAEYMGVSNGAVSKWEKGLSYPDITLLPRLAAYFNLSIDDLLGYTPQLNRDSIWKLCNRLSAEFVQKPYDEAMIELRTAVKQFYSCFSLLYHVALLLMNHHQHIEKPEQRDEMLAEAKALCERVVSECGDALLAKDALFLQAYCCLLLHQPDAVFALIGESLQMKGFTEDDIISQAFQLAGNTVKAKEISQCGIYTHLRAMIESILTYTLLCEDTLDVAETAHCRAMEIINLFGLAKLDLTLTAKAYLIGAELNCRLGRLDKAMGIVEKFVQLYALTAVPKRFQEDSFFTTMEQWRDCNMIGSETPFDERMVKKNLLNAFTALPSLSVLHDQPRYKSVIRKLTEMANAETM